jgi:hypothetical protein
MVSVRDQVDRGDSRVPWLRLSRKPASHRLSRSTVCRLPRSLLRPEGAGFNGDFAARSKGAQIKNRLRKSSLRCCEPPEPRSCSQEQKGRGRRSLGDEVRQFLFVQATCQVFGCARRVAVAHGPPSRASSAAKVEIGLPTAEASVTRYRSTRFTLTGFARCRRPESMSCSWRQWWEPRWWQ